MRSLFRPLPLITFVCVLLAAIAASQFLARPPAPALRTTSARTKTAAIFAPAERTGSVSPAPETTSFAATEEPAAASPVERPVEKHAESTPVRWADDILRERGALLRPGEGGIPQELANDVAGLRTAAEAAALQSHWPDVEALLARACTLEPRDAALRQEYGTVLMGLGRWTEACAQLARALELEPERVKAWHNLAIAHRQCGHLADAERAFSREIELNGDLDDAYAYRGEIRLELHDFSGAADDFEEVLARDPAAVAAALNLALVRRQTGDFEGARDVLNNILERVPRNVPALNRLATLEMEACESRQPGSAASRAIDYCTRSLAIDPAQDAIQELLVRARRTQGASPK